jgi:hypothetical protein
MHRIFNNMMATVQAIDQDNPGRKNSDPEDVRLAE